MVKAVDALPLTEKEELDPFSTPISSAGETDLQVWPVVNIPKENPYKDTLQKWTAPPSLEKELDSFGLALDEMCQHPDWVPSASKISQGALSVAHWIVSLTRAPKSEELTQEGVEICHFEGTQTPFLQKPSKVSGTSAQQFLNEMNQLLAQIDDMGDEEEGNTQFEAFLNKIFLSQINRHEERLVENKEKVQKARQELQELNEKRLEQIESLLKQVGKNRRWGKLENGVTALGLLTAVSGAKGWKIAGLAFSAGVLGDDLLGDPIKSSLSTLISGGDEETEEKWLERMRLAAGLVSFISVLAIGGSSQYNQAVSSGQALLKAMKSYTQYQTNLLQADSIELNEEMEKKHRSLKKKLKKAQEIISTIQETFSRLNTIQKQVLEASLTMSQRL